MVSEKGQRSLLDELEKKPNAIRQKPIVRGKGGDMVELHFRLPKRNPSEKAMNVLLDLGDIGPKLDLNIYDISARVVVKPASDSLKDYRRFKGEDTFPVWPGDSLAELATRIMNRIDKADDNENPPTELVIRIGKTEYHKDEAIGPYGFESRKDFDGPHLKPKKGKAKKGPKRGNNKTIKGRASPTVKRKAMGRSRP